MSDTIIMYENGKAVGGEGHPTNADEITFDNSNTNLVSEEVESAIKEVNAKFDRGSVRVTANGSKTYRTLLNELYAQMVSSKISSRSYLQVGNVIYHSSVGKTIYSNSLTQGSYLAITTVEFSPSTSKMYTGNVRSNGLTITDDSSAVPQSGLVITFVY